MLLAVGLGLSVLGFPLGRCGDGSVPGAALPLVDRGLCSPPGSLRAWASESVPDSGPFLSLSLPRLGGCLSARPPVLSSLARRRGFFVHVAPSGLGAVFAAPLPWRRGFASLLSVFASPFLGGLESPYGPTGIACSLLPPALSPICLRPLRYWELLQPQGRGWSSLRVLRVTCPCRRRV